jgi:hypothetical protein
MTGAAAIILSHHQEAEKKVCAMLALKESEEKYRTLFVTIDEGFLIGKLLRDADGCVVDYTILEFNPAFERISGVSCAGRLHSEVLPNAGRLWLKHCEYVADTGRSARFEFFSEAVQRWFGVLLFRHGRDQVAMLCDEITGRKRAEAELQSRNEELERFNKAAVGRELRMIELKEEINELRSQRGEPRRYALDFKMSNTGSKDA